MNHKEQIEREAAELYDKFSIQYYAFVSGAKFALEMVLKELEAKRTEVIQINGLRSDVVAWSDIEALLGKFNAGF